MPSKTYKSFEYFCENINVRYVENGVFEGSDWEYEELQAPYNRLYIIMDGEGRVVIGDKEYTLTKGSVYMIPQNTNFSCYTPKYIQKLYVHFCIDSHFHAMALDQIDTVLEIKVEQDYTYLLNILEEKDTSGYYQIKGEYVGLIYGCMSLVEWSRWGRAQTIGQPIIDELHQLLRDQLTARTRTADLADKLNISQSMLAKIYKKETGTTLKCYMQQQLMQKAQIMLLTTSKSIQEIASELEYDDALYFSRVFSKWRGEPPTVYRKRNKMV